jgi:small GTP-binding protein
MNKQPLDGSAVADRLLDVFTRQPNLLSVEQLQALRRRIEQVVNYQAVVGVMGKTGAGKSSLCNALFGQEVSEVSDIGACTRYPQEITLAYKQGKGLALIDMPGVGESEARDQEYADLYRSMLPELDLVLWLVKADDRALSIDERFYRQIVQPYLQQHRLPLVLVISQCDKVEPCRAWDEARQQPGQQQEQNIHSKRGLLSRLFNLPLTCICAASAEYGYGLEELVDKVVKTLPNEKKWGFTREAKTEHVSATARQESAQGIWETIKVTVTEMASEAWTAVSSGVASLVKSIFGWLF